MPVRRAAARRLLLSIRTRASAGVRAPRAAAPPAVLQGHPGGVTVHGQSFAKLVDALSELRRHGAPRPMSPARSAVVRLIVDHRALGEREAAALLGVSRWTVRQWAAEGVLEPVSAEPLAVSPESAAWIAGVLDEVAGYPETVRRSLIEASLVDRSRVLAAVLRGRQPQPDRVSPVDLTDRARTPR